MEWLAAHFLTLIWLFIAAKCIHQHGLAYLEGREDYRGAKRLAELSPEYASSQSYPKDLRQIRAIRIRYFARLLIVVVVNVVVGILALILPFGAGGDPLVGGLDIDGFHVAYQVLGTVFGVWFTFGLVLSEVTQYALTVLDRWTRAKNSDRVFHWLRRSE